jgi:hypothetical protein
LLCERILHLHRQTAKIGYVSGGKGERVVLGCGGQEAVQDREWTKGHELTPGGSLGCTDRQQAASASKIALESVAPAPKMVPLDGIAPSDEGDATPQFGQGDCTEEKLTSIPALEPSH